MLTKHFRLTQVYILPFSNFERENAGTYSVGITVVILCFWVFFSNTIDQFQYIKIQPKTIDLSTRLNFSKSQPRAEDY